MRLIENIKLALSSLRAGKMRALLTMLGIIIGIGSVIAIVTVGNSLTMSITSAMNDMGVNQIQAYVTTKERNVEREMTDNDYIPEEWINEFAEKYADEVDSVLMYAAAGSGQAKDGRKYANVSITGCAVDGAKNEGVDLIRGRDITERDIKGAKNVAVVSNVFVKKMFGDKTNPLGKEVTITTPSYGILTFTIIGVYKFELPAFLSSFAPDEDRETSMIIPLTTAKRISGAPDGFGYFIAKTAEGADSYQLTTKMEEFFQEKYDKNPHWTVFTQNMEGMMDQMTTMLSTLTIAIGIIAFISLIVGGIGVMNIMLVSVTERTREIGTRKALGARSSAIMSQFIVEAMIICLIGGMIGILTGLGLGWLGSTLLKFPAQPSILVIVIAVMVSMIIGVVSGLYPAYKASKMDPIEALRYE